MISSLELRNFRSIERATAGLSSSGLNVLVGANGSGKTNFVKALLFLGDVGTHGFEAAMRTAGGPEGIVPKRLDRRDAKNLPTKIIQTNELPDPEDFPDDLPNPAVTYELDFSWRVLESCQIQREKLTFDNPIIVARCLRAAVATAERSAELRRTADRLPTSKIVVSREGHAAPEYNFAFENPNDYIDDLVFWFGFNNTRPNGGRLFSDVEALKTYLTTYTKLRRKDVSVSHGVSSRMLSIVEASGLYALESSVHYSVYRSQLISVERYDFTLANLRSDQQHDVGDRLSHDGQNFPSVLRRLQADPEKSDSVDKIAATLQAVAPHIDGFGVRRLSTGKEFVRFVERLAARRVESWNTSDGTLRLLGFLLALETHRERSTLIIEEPERGLHPWALPHLIRHVREVINRRELQVLLTTHSEQLLDCVEPGEVFIFNRDAATGTSIRPVTEVVPAEAIERGEVGRLWSKGLLGGVPGYD